DETKTTFVKPGKNLFDGVFEGNLSYRPKIEGQREDSLAYTDESNKRKVAIVEIDPGLTYTITKYLGGDRFNVMTVNEIPDGVSVETVPLEYLYQGDFGSGKRTHTFTNQDNAKYLVIQSNFDV